MRLEFVQTVAASIQAVFAFHEDPGNLEGLHEGWPGFRVLRHGGAILPGNETWFEQTVLRCVPVVMGFRHTHYDPPNGFAETLIHGPFAEFTHTHAFASTDHGTIIADIIDVRVSSYFGGDIAAKYLVEPRIRRAFKARHRAVEALVSNGKIAAPAAPASV